MIIIGERGRPNAEQRQDDVRGTKILDFGGFDSSRILVLRGGTLMSTGNFLEGLSQGVLAGIILVGRLGAKHCRTGTF